MTALASWALPLPLASLILVKAILCAAILAPTHRTTMTDPIPVAEQPGPDDMKDGRCWWFFPENPFDVPYWNFEAEQRFRAFKPTHWLPAHALPLPTND